MAAQKVSEKKEKLELPSEKEFKTMLKKQSVPSTQGFYAVYHRYSRST